MSSRVHGVFPPPPHHGCEGQLGRQQQEESRQRQQWRWHQNLNILETLTTLKTLTQRLIQGFCCQYRCDDLMFSFTCCLLSLYLHLLLSSSLTLFVVSNPPASVYCICPDSHCDRPPEAYVPPQLFYNGKVDYFDLQRLGGLLSHLKKTLKGKFDCFKEVQTGSYISTSSVKKHSSLVCLEPAGGETFLLFFWFKTIPSYFSCSGELFTLDELSL